MLISDHKLRHKRSVEKQEKILRWLSGEVWTTTEIISELLSISRQAAWKTLRQMEVKMFVRHSDIALYGTRKIQLWGITAHGAAFSIAEDESFDDLPTFDPSRVALSMVPHQLLLQMARVRAERSGWTNWVRGERLGFRVKNRPDAIARDPSGKMVAQELERTIKTRKRYRQIMGSHLMRISEGKWDYVQYICPDKEMVPRLERIFRSIDYVVLNGQRAQINEKHQRRFQFEGLEDWPDE